MKGANGMNDDQRTMENMSYTESGNPTCIAINISPKKNKKLSKEIKVSYKSETIDFDIEAEIHMAMGSIDYQQCAASLHNGERILVFAKEI
jgi:hypothetical protein